MEISMISLVVAVLCAGVSGGALAYFVSDTCLAKIRNQRVASRSGAEGSFFAMQLRQGVRALEYPAQYLLKMPQAARFFERLRTSIEYVGYQTSLLSLASLFIGCVVAVLVFVTLVSQSLLCGVAMAVCVVLLASVWMTRRQEQRQTDLREAIPEALQSMKACFQVGYSLPQTIQEVRQHTQGPLSGLFGQMQGILETGGSIEEALAVLKKQKTEPELVFLATALEIQHKTGSSMQQVLEITRQSIRDEIELKRTLRTQTAQAKLSAQIVTIMPFALIGLFSLASPGFLDPFFESVAGFLLLFVALGMQMAGIVLVKRLLKIEVV